MRLVLEFEFPDDPEVVESLKRILNRVRKEEGRTVYYTEVPSNAFYKIYGGPGGLFYKRIVPTIFKLMKNGTMKIELIVEEGEQ